MAKNPTTTRDEKTADAIAAVVAPIVEAIEAGIANPRDWSAPWHAADPLAFMPHNPATGRDYTAGNRLGLYMTAAAIGAPHHWATFKQWQQLGACVRKGERAVARILRPQIVKKVDESGVEREKCIGYSSYVVFHAGQVDGYDMPVVEHAPTLPADDRDDVDRCYLWAAGIGARVEESPTAGASYSRTLDRVMMPDRDRFTTSHGAWSTMAHELTHWTGHESRLSREFGKRFGDDAYAAEELVAELGAAFTLAAIGRSTEPREDHAQYLASWLRVLKANPSHLFTVASAAERAAGYLIDHATIGAELIAA